LIRSPFARFLIATAFALMAASSGEAGMPGRELEDTGAFKVGYELYVGYLFVCGNDALAKLAAQAVMARVDACPFAARAKTDFHTWSKGTMAKLRARRSRYIAENGRLPDRLDGMHMSCDEERHSREFLKRRDELIRYGKGRLGASEIVTGPCETSPGGL
jgi:hypothetical protein